jgi:iron complex transport system ATP-binding protein
VTTLAARALAGGYGDRAVVAGLDIELEPGRCLAVIGPNGAGKSTLLRLLAGILPATAGTVTLLGRPLPSWRRRDIARHVGLVPQHVDLAFPLSVQEVVEQGRAPHLGPWSPRTEADTAAVTRALAEVGLADRPDVPVPRLSGGERQLVLLARALACEPVVLLLDEPASALDVAHQLQLVAIVRRRLDEGAAAIIVLHDWNLALRLADDLLVLDGGRTAAAGPVGAILSPALFARVFGVEVEVLEQRGQRVIVPTGAVRPAR